MIDIDIDIDIAQIVYVFRTDYYLVINNKLVCFSLEKIVSPTFRIP